MDRNWLGRTEMITGSGALARLAVSRVAVFGLGGVGGHAVEALARSGIGALDLIDMDTVEETNLNRQLAALRSTVGKRKTEVLKERVLDINPDCRVTVHDLFYLPETAAAIDLSAYDFVVDAIDNMTAKLFLAEETGKLGVPLIASMGTGNRLDPSALCVTDISKTHDDPLAKNMRTGLRKRGIVHLPVVWSSEIPAKTGAQTPGSAAFVPAAAGLLLASYVVRSIISGTAGSENAADGDRTGTR